MRKIPGRVIGGCDDGKPLSMIIVDVVNVVSRNMIMSLVSVGLSSMSLVSV